MTRSAASRWALSPLDHKAHLLLPEGGHPGVLVAYCGHLLPTVATVHGQPPTGGAAHPATCSSKRRSTRRDSDGSKQQEVVNQETPSGRRFLSACLPGFQAVGRSHHRKQHKESPMMLLRRRRAAKHRLQPPVRRMVAMVDISGEVHLLTPDAAAAGVSGQSRYVAVCGANVVPAALIDPRQRYCWPCRSTTSGIPSQRSRSAARR